MSPICESILIGEIEFPNNSYLIGDLAYPLSTKLLVGFKDNGHLTAPQINLNQMLARVRIIIKHAFEILKKLDLGDLRFIETKLLDFVSLLVITSCI